MFFSEAADVGATDFEDPQPTQAEHRDQGESTGPAMFGTAGAFPQPLTTAVLFVAAGGLGAMSINVLTMTLNQALIPPEIFGRVQGGGASSRSAWPRSAPLLVGMFAQTFGVRSLYIAAGVLQVLLPCRCGC